MKFEDLSPGSARECVDHYRMTKEDDGAGGFRRVPVMENESLRVAWEDRTPNTAIEGQSLSASLDAQIGVRRSVDIRPDDWIVHSGYVYRVIRPRVRQASRWQIVALEFRPEWDPSAGQP